MTAKPWRYGHAVRRKFENLRAKKYSDPMTLRLQQVITGMLNPGNLYAYEYVLPRLPSDAPIVEIGTFVGLSTNLLSHFKRRHGKTNRLITCDRWDYGFKGLSEAPVVEGAPVTGDEFGRFARETFIRNTTIWSKDDLPYAIEAYSDQFFDAWRGRERRTDVFGREIELGGPISFAFIDGNHDYEYVKSDFENVDHWLEPRGWILFDDSAHLTGSPGTRRFVAELKSRGVFGARYEVVMKNPHYLVRKVP